MTDDGKRKLKFMLCEDESYSQFPYFESNKNITVGYGRNLTSRGVSIDEALMMLEHDIDYFYHKLMFHLKFFSSLNEARQIALINMAYTVGLRGFLKFVDMLLYLESHQYEKAAGEMLNSKWAEQVGERANRLAHIICVGEL